MANYTFQINPIPDVANGHTFTGDNFLQMSAHTKILEGKTGLTFINCNLTNCDIPVDATTNIQPRHASFCSNLHPNWVARGLQTCAVNCEHVTSTDKVTVDGVLVDTVYHYSDKAVA